MLPNILITNDFHGRDVVDNMGLANLLASNSRGKREGMGCEGVANYIQSMCIGQHSKILKRILVIKENVYILLILWDG